MPIEPQSVLRSQSANKLLTVVQMLPWRLLADLRGTNGAEGPAAHLMLAQLVGSFHLIIDTQH
jgi:hypothetical protein